MSHARRAVSISFACAITATAIAVTPEFEKIARTNDPVPGRGPGFIFNGRAFQANETPGVLSLPTINENGDVAFRGVSTGGGGFNDNPAIGLYIKLAGQPLARIVDTTQTVTVGTSNLTFTNFDPPLLNNAGHVVFYATYSGGSGFFATDDLGVTIVKIVDTSDQVPGYPGTTFNNGFKFGSSFARYVLISLNDLGQVVFMGGFQRSGAPFVDFGYYGSTIAGGTPVRLVDTAGTVLPADKTVAFRSLSQSELPALNNNGVVIFEGAIGPTAANIIQGIWTIPVDGSAAATTRALRGQVVTMTDGSTLNLNTSFTGQDIADNGDFSFQHAFGNTSTSVNAIFAGNIVNPFQSNLTSIVDSTGGVAVPDRSSADYQLIQFGPLNEMMQTAFHATDNGTAVSNSSGAYFSNAPGDPVALLANNEQIPPGRTAPATFGAMNDPRSVRFDLNDSGNAVLELPTVNEAGNDSVFGLYFWESCSESLQRIVDASTASMPLPDGLGGSFASAGCSGSPCERAMTINRSLAHRNGHFKSMNSNNDVTFLTAFSTFDVGIYVAHIDAGGGTLTIECPANITLECGDDISPANTGEATADGCGTVTIMYSDSVTADCGGAQTIERTWTADNGGSPATCVQTITVVDTTAPTLTCPTDLTVECDEASNADDFAAWLASASATDGCGSATVTPDVTELAAGCGDTVVTFTATDECGNDVSCTATFTIEDTTDPILTCPSDLTVECDGAGNAADLSAWLDSATATDDCGEVTITNDFASLAGACGNTGSATVTWTATDVCGNTATCSATFTVDDTTDPMLSCPTDMTVECDGAGNQAELDAWLNSASASDDCGNVTITNDYAGMSSACGGTGSATVTWTAMDDCGNTAMCSATFTIEDTTDPLLTAPADLTVGIDPGVCTASNVDLGTPTSGDACGSVVVENDAPATFAIGSTTVTWTATDECGNVTTATQTVTVENLSPTADMNVTQLTDIGATAQVRLDGSGSSDPEDANSELEFEWTVDGNVVCSGTGATCEDVTVYLSYGAHTVTLRVTDRCGDFSEITTNLMVDPAELSVLEVNRTIIRFCTNPPRATIRGRIGLPLGVDYSEVAPQAVVNVAVAGVEILPPTPVSFSTLGANDSHWVDWHPFVQYGVQRFNINWQGNSYQYREAAFPIDLQSDIITTTESLLEVRARRRNQIPGPFTLNINGQAMVGFDEDFNVVASNVDYDVEVAGKRVVLTLPFPLTASSVITFGGSLPNTINVADGLTASLGRFTMKVKFDESLLPDGVDSMPVQLDLGVTIGAEGYPGVHTSGPEQYAIGNCHWRTWDCDEDDDDSDD